jgi:hypothetical protein
MTADDIAQIKAAGRVPSKGTIKEWLLKINKSV